MSTGIILGLGLLTIIVVFYIMLNISYWKSNLEKRKIFMTKEKKYHHWVYAADDSMNKTLKIIIYCVYGYGAYIFFAEMWEKFI